MVNVKAFILRNYKFVMGLVRIYFHPEMERFLRAILMGTVRTITPKSPRMGKIMTVRAEKGLEFEPATYSKNIKTVLLDAGQLSKLYDFFQVATIKRWGRKGEKGRFLAAEILANAKRKETGLLITPFKRRDLLRKGRTPQSDKTGQIRIEVNQKENIVKAAFKHYGAKGLDPQRLLLVARPRVQALIPEPRQRLPKIRIRPGRKLAEPVNVLQRIDYAGNRFFVVSRRDSPENVLAIKRQEEFFRIGEKAAKTIRSKGKTIRRRL